MKAKEAAESLVELGPPPVRGGRPARLALPELRMAGYWTRSQDYDSVVCMQAVACAAALRLPPTGDGARRVSPQSRDFEQLVLLAILQLRGEVYGVPIVDEIERRTGRTVSRAAVYVTLRRLEEKGFVSSWLSESAPERGGKPRRCVRVEPLGLKLLRESREAVNRMWRGLDPRLGRVR